MSYTYVIKLNPQHFILFNGKNKLYFYLNFHLVAVTIKTSRRSNQPILKEISPGCSLEGMMLKLKLQYFGHLMWRVDSLEKTLMLGGIGGRRRRGRQRMRWLDGITDSWTWVWVYSRSWWWTRRPGVLRFMGSQRVWHSWVTELNSTIWTLNWSLYINPISCGYAKDS